MTAFQELQNIERKRALQQQIHVHKAKQFDFASIRSSIARRILKTGLSALGGNTGYRISAAGTIGGMTVSDARKIINAYFKEHPHDTAAMGQETLLALGSAGIMLNVE
jgi:hypothetical protein